MKLCYKKRKRKEKKRKEKKRKQLGERRRSPYLKLKHKIETRSISLN